MSSSENLSAALPYRGGKMMKGENSQLCCVGCDVGEEIKNKSSEQVYGVARKYRKYPVMLSVFPYFYFTYISNC